MRLAVSLTNNKQYLGEADVFSFYDHQLGATLECTIEDNDGDPTIVSVLHKGVDIAGWIEPGGAKEIEILDAFDVCVNRQRDCLGHFGL